jgi:anaerobic glycerol-3-phosphate dehydrogenase
MFEAQYQLDRLARSLYFETNEYGKAPLGLLTTAAVEKKTFEVRMKTAMKTKGTCYVAIDGFSDFDSHCVRGYLGMRVHPSTDQSGL